MSRFYWGIDIGSLTVKAVVLDGEGALVAHRYRRSEGKSRTTLISILDELLSDFPEDQLASVLFTGSGGNTISRLVGGQHINELVAQTRSVGEYYPDTQTVIEIGGQDSKYLAVNWNEQTGKMDLVDFTMNSLCAAGTGSFLDQQAERLGVSITDEFADLALQATNPARVAGRCTVFAKSDMIHLQQKGTPMPDILAGLCLAMTRNFRSVIGKGKPFTPPILFQGGVAFNLAVAKAFETVLHLKKGDLIIPEYHWLMPALGVALLAKDEAQASRPPSFTGWRALTDAQAIASVKKRKRMPNLISIPPIEKADGHDYQPTSTSARQKLPVFLGIDVGSISTNVVLIDGDGRVIARRYLFTAGQPLQAVQQGLGEVAAAVGDHVQVMGVGTTGSGRYLTGHFVGADVVRNEITAQARAAIQIDPTVDTIFEIGGQDSKYISLHRGAIVDFAMNNACAAGTGSFLQEQADRLHIDIENEFSSLAFDAAAPACLGERCTVFMESDLIHHQQQGADVSDLTAGLAYSIAQNYLNRVVNKRAIGRNIFFQGGVAWNESVVAAFRQLSNRAITVPPHHDVTGAIGVALLAMEEMQARQSNNKGYATTFKGFDLVDDHFETTTFECKKCPNLCEVSRFVVADEPPIYFGARCDIFEEAGRRRNRGDDIPDLFAERAKLLMGDYHTPAKEPSPRRLRVAMPRALTFYDMFPYWRTFFKVLDIDLVLSPETNPQTLRLTAEHANAEMCLPAKAVFGHAMQLQKVQKDGTFIPGVRNRENIATGQPQNFYCPFIQAIPYLVQAHFELHEIDENVLTFPYYLLWPEARKKMLQPLAKQLQRPLADLYRAADLAAIVQKEFYATLRQRGREVLDSLAPDQTAVVIVGRPYNTNDAGLSQDLPQKLRKLGVLPLPMDYLPLNDIDVSDHFSNICWRSGQDILAAATIIRDDPRLQAIYLTNFNCGPDSFLLSFFRMILDKKPFLELEIDDHTADAGVMTRCEAFLESLKMGSGVVLS